MTEPLYDTHNGVVYVPCSVEILERFAEKPELLWVLWDGHDLILRKPEDAPELVYGGNARV